MATISSPYGLRAVNELGGLPYAGSTRTFLIDPAGYATNIYNGSIVYVNAAGYINIVATTGADVTTNSFPTTGAFTGAIGIFVGCSYVNAQGQQMFGQYYPSGTTGVVTAYVIDDDRAVFQVQAAAALTQAAVGQNVYLSTAQTTSTGSTQNGNSNSKVSATTATASAAFRVIGFASPVGDAFPDLLVKFNPGHHSYSNAVGL